MKKVLVVDDSALMRTAISNILTKNGYKVVGEAENGKRAFLKYVELAPDIVTLDITMHDMDGISALREIINYDRNANVVMVSAMGQKPIVMQAVTIGAKGFLVKPFNESDVITTLARLFE